MTKTQSEAIISLVVQSINQTNRSQFVNSQASINGARWLIKRAGGDFALSQMVNAAQRWLEESDHSNIGNRPLSVCED